MSALKYMFLTSSNDTEVSNGRQIDWTIEGEGERCVAKEKRGYVRQKNHTVS